MREAPSVERFMKRCRLKLIRHMVIYSKAHMSASQVDPWAMLRQMVADFNLIRAEAIEPWMTQILDESLSTYKPRKDKQGGLPSISFIFCKPKPFGTEFKTICDADIG
jgi:hypothetical protein